MNFQAWQPYLLTGRLFKARRPARRRGPVLFMGFGMYMFLACARGIGYMLLLELTVTWDILVIFIYAYAYAGWLTWRGCVLGVGWTSRRLRARREARAAV